MAAMVKATIDSATITAVRRLMARATRKAYSSRAVARYWIRAGTR
jgi:hypothetical protein